MVLLCLRPGVLGLGQFGRACGWDEGVGTSRAPISPRSASSNESMLPGRNASSSPSAVKNAAMSESDMGARELPKGSDWCLRWRDAALERLLPMDWFRELSPRLLRPADMVLIGLECGWARRDPAP